MQHLYAMSAAPYIVSESDRPYTLKFRDIPSDQKPRERMVSEGPSALSVAELLAIVLST